MRVRKKPWFDKELNISKNLIESPSQLKGKWQDYFGNDNPVHIELGCGKGGFINASALRNPDINYIGLEREPKIVAYALRTARETGSPANLAFIISDVKEISEYFGKGEISRIYINFCDPWHRRKRWIKRRLTHRSYLFIYESLFNEGECEIFLKTDNAILFEFSISEFIETGWRLSNVTTDLHKSGLDGNIMTEYEKKFFEQGLPISRLEAYK